MTERERADGAPSLDPVRAQYEAYPYPPRDPADEARRLITGSPSHLDEIDHYVFGGARRRDRPLRALVAGGGTGDGAVMLAQQLADRARNEGGPEGEVVYLDVSTASRAVAEARIRARGLRNVRFVEASLVDLPALGLGRFDYIDCCGVLHHLPDPAAGLATLAAALDPGGGMGLMLYGALGRTGVYPVQRALRALIAAGGEGEVPGSSARVGLARRLLDDLPPTNWLRRNTLVADHLTAGDAGLYDLLLHARDRAYTVPEIFDLAAGAGLVVTAFLEPVRYDPTVYLKDAGLAARARALSWPEACALAENLAGNLKTHVFYAVRADRPADAGPPVARPAGPGVVPVLRDGRGEELARGFAKAGRLRVDLDGVEVRFALPEGAAELTALIDGRRSLDDMRAALGLDWFAFKARFDRLYAVLNPLNILLLRAAQAS